MVWRGSKQCYYPGGVIVGVGLRPCPPSLFVCVCGGEAKIWEKGIATRFWVQWMPSSVEYIMFGAVGRVVVPCCIFLLPV